MSVNTRIMPVTPFKSNGIIAYIAPACQFNMLLV